jgi:hypothetical protein
MGIPRPKILTAFTIPTGGWTFKLYVSRLAEYDTAVSVSLAAGDYFVAWDCQSDDFLFYFSNQVNAAIDAAHAAFPTDSIAMWIDSSHKVNIGFDASYYSGNPARGIKLAWTENDGDDVAAVLGFDSSADDTNSSAGGSNYKVFVADWHHAYGWYADEDGLIENLNIEDASEVYALQSRAHSGAVRTQRIAQRFSNTLSLQFLPRNKTFSQNVAYGAANVHPYERNWGLECWWIAAQQGTRFRVYRDGRQDVASASVTGSSTASNTTTLTNSNVSMDTDPQAYKGRLLYVPVFGAGFAVNPETSDLYPARFYISSHTATVFTVANAHPIPENISGQISTYYVFDQPYQTYVLNLDAMKTFAPRELPALDRYSIDLPLYRYV